MNACELEIDLFCRGIRVPDNVSLDGARGISRTRAGLGSGLELVIPTGSRLKPEIWMNAPVAERFAQSSPYALVGGPGLYEVYDERDAESYSVRVPRRPGWYRPAHVARRSDVPRRRPAGHLPRHLCQRGLRILVERPQLPLLYDRPQRRRCGSGTEGRRGRRRDVLGRQGSVGHHLRASQRRIPGRPRPRIRRPVRQGDQAGGGAARGRPARARARLHPVPIG